MTEHQRIGRPRKTETPDGRRKDYRRVSGTYDGDERVFIDWSVARLVRYFGAVRDRLPFDYWRGKACNLYTSSPPRTGKRIGT